MNEVREAAKNAARELLQEAKLESGQIVVVGCSTSEIAGCAIGSSSSAEIGATVFEALYQIFSQAGIVLAAQCCEHLNRAIIIERAYVAGFEIVNAVPSLKAGGGFASAAYINFNDPVAIEEVRADAGLDIGGTLIAMHLKRVAVPIRLKTGHVGKAAITAARTRPKLIGGSRTGYDDSIM